MIKLLEKDPRFPKFFFGNTLAIGAKKFPKKDDPLFWIEDFPLKRKEDLWEKFPSYFSFSPEEIKEIPPFNIANELPPLEMTAYLPDFEEWIELVKKMQGNKNLEKTILARIRTNLYEQNLSAISLFFSLRNRSRGALPFAFLLSPKLAFVGVTPETLYRKKGLQIETEALAGTIKLGKEEALLHSKKDHHEFRIVKEEITKKLQSICHPFVTDSKVFVKETETLCHLHYPFKAKLKDDLSDKELTTLFHPTPAIGGYPRNKALDFIQENELFDRGYYTGTFGMRMNGVSDVKVAIRCALVEENLLHIFTGAGITHNSLPEMEWKELNLKETFIL